MEPNTNEELSIRESAIKLGRLITGPAVLACGAAAAATGAYPTFLALGTLAAGITYFSKSKDTPEQREMIESKGHYTKFLINGARAISATIGGATAIATVGAAVLALPVAAVCGSDIGIGGQIAALFNAGLGSIILDKAYLEFKAYRKNKLANEALETYENVFVKHGNTEGVLERIGKFRNTINNNDSPNKLSI